jgi:glutathione S-transferase
MLTLYFAPGSSSFAVHIALHEIGVPFEGRPMSFKERPALAGLSRAQCGGKVPTLIIDGRPLTEVAAILYYLAKTLSRRRAVAARRHRGSTRRRLSWMSFAASTLHLARRTRTRLRQRSLGIADRRLGTAGRSAAIRSPTSICFGSIGGSPIRSSPRPKRFPNLTAHYARHDGPSAVQRTIAIESAIGYELPA